MQEPRFSAPPPPLPETDWGPSSHSHYVAQRRESKPTCRPHSRCCQDQHAGHCTPPTTPASRGFGPLTTQLNARAPALQELEVGERGPTYRAARGTFPLFKRKPAPHRTRRARAGVMRPQMEREGCASACGNRAMLGSQGGTEEGRGGSCAVTPVPIHTFPSAELQGSAAGLSIQDPTSQLCIHPSQRASSKQVHTARRKETIAHNHRADSLSFQSSFLKQWGTDASGERTKLLCLRPGLARWQRALAGSRRPALAKQPWCNGALQRPRGAAHTARRAGSHPALGQSTGPATESLGGVVTRRKNNSSSFRREGPSADSSSGAPSSAHPQAGHTMRFSSNEYPWMISGTGQLENQPRGAYKVWPPGDQCNAFTSPAK